MQWFHFILKIVLAPHIYFGFNIEQASGDGAW